MEQKPTKSGVILEDIRPEDYLFGKLGDTEIKVPDGNWTPFLPKNEKQRQGFESMCCTNFSSTTAVEILITRLIEAKLISADNLSWLNDNGYIDDSGHINFSDRFDAIMSNTSWNYGNTLKAPADAKHKYGLIPEKMLPWVDDPATYFSKSSVTQAMKDMGLEFLKRFQIGYEMVYPNEYQTALRVSPLASACYAWNGTNQGIYYKVTNQINHAICVIKQPDPWAIMDSYDPFIKKLANNYLFSGHAIRYVVTEVHVKKNMLQKVKGDEKVYLVINNKAYWIRKEENFNDLKSAQPITGIDWVNVQEVDNVDWDGVSIIGSQPNKNTILLAITNLFKTIFGKKK